MCPRRRGIYCNPESVFPHSDAQCFDVNSKAANTGSLGAPLQAGRDGIQILFKIRLSLRGWRETGQGTGHQFRSRRGVE